MAEEMNGQTGNGVPNEGTGAVPGMVDFEFEGEKLTVPENVAQKLQSGVMAHSDYTRKTQELADNRRAFEEDHRTAMALNQFLEDNPDQVDVVNAIFTGDREKAKDLMSAENPNESDAKLENRLNKLESKVQNKMTADLRNNTINSYFDDARKKYDDFDSPEVTEEMGKLLSQKNPAIPVYLAATLPKKIKEAEEAGYKKGVQKAYQDFENRLLDTPPIGGAGGDVNSRPDSTSKSAAARAIAKMRQGTN